MMTELLLDLDTKMQPQKLEEKIITRLRFIKYLFSISPQIMSLYKTKHGYHIRIQIRESLPKKDICFFQLALGSDPNRELFNWRRLSDPTYPFQWNLLFKEKYRNGKLVSKEKLVKTITFPFPPPPQSHL